MALKEHSLVRQICASTAGSIISTLSLNPITVVKVRLQNASSGTANSAALPLRAVVANVLAERGIWGFWAGTRMGIIMSVPNTVLYMSVYEQLKLKFAEDSRLSRVRAITPAMAGALARMVSVTIITPLELIRTIQTGGVNQGIMEIAGSVVRDEGIRGLYRGKNTRPHKHPLFDTFFSLFVLFLCAQVGDHQCCGTVLSAGYIGWASRRCVPRTASSYTP